MIKKSNCISGYGLLIKKSSWSFDDDFNRNVIIFAVYYSSSSYAENLKNDFLILGDGNVFGINGSFGVPEKNSS